MNNTPQNKSNGTWLRSMTRLLVGGAELGLGILLRNLESLDQQFTGKEKEAQETPGQATAAVDEHESHHLPHALIGLFFETQDALLAGLEAIDRLSRTADRLSAPWLRPLQRSRLLRPLRRQFDYLAKRGESEVMRWTERGRREVGQSRKLTQTAISTAVEQNIERLTTNPQVQELVQTQSTSLANEVLEEIRERTVSADNYLEGIARRIFRRKPRQQLLPPPQEMLARAAGSRVQSRKRTLQQ